jgi:uncharacterized protein Yka (UPF0111/DUF47 family)
VATGNGNGSGSQVGLLLQVVGKVDGLEEKVDRLEKKVDRLEKRCDHFFDHFSEQMREVKETLGVIAATLAKSVQVNSARFEDHEHRISKLEKSAG